MVAITVLCFPVFLLGGVIKRYEGGLFSHLLWTLHDIFSGVVDAA